MPDFISPRSVTISTNAVSAPKELSPVEGAVARLQDLQSSVGSVLGHLEKRLEPLLVVPLGPAPDGAGRVRVPGNVPLVDAIHSRADTEAYTLDRLRSLLERLAV